MKLTLVKLTLVKPSLPKSTMSQIYCEPNLLRFVHCDSSVVVRLSRFRERKVVSKHVLGASILIRGHGSYPFSEHVHRPGTLKQIVQGLDRRLGQRDGDRAGAGFGLEGPLVLALGVSHLPEGVLDCVGQSFEVPCVKQQGMLAEGNLDTPAALALQNVPVASFEESVRTVEIMHGISRNGIGCRS